MELVTDRSQGVQLAPLQKLARYWVTDYDWRKAEARLNALPQFTTKIDGVEIHFIHVKSAHENALPLIMTHGWPGSVFSGEPTELGWNVGRVAKAWAELMRRLGYTRYVAQGGDVGASVTDQLGRQAPEGLVGIHTNLLVTGLAGGPMPSESEEERAALEQINTFKTSGFGYFLEQATRPQTIRSEE